MNSPFSDPLVDKRKESLLDNTAASAFLRQVYTVMTLGMAITGLAAWYIGGKLMGGEWLWLVQSPTIYILAFSPLMLVWVLSARVERMSYQTVNLMFASYALLNGVALSPLLLIYTGASLAKTFFITAGTFGAMSIIGITTKQDLTKMGAYLQMAVIGLIIAMVVNFFLKSPVVDYIVSAIGVVVFAGLTAYDTQKLLNFGAMSNLEDEPVRKMVVMGALTLYLDFLNLFLFLLRFFGGSRD